MDKIYILNCAKLHKEEYIMRVGTEQKMTITLGKHFRIVRTEIIKGAVEIIYEFESEYFSRYFPIVNVEELSLEDDFLKNYRPETEKQEKLKRRIENAINAKVKNFRRPIVDPAFDRKGEIIFEEGRIPAVGKSADWWYGAAKDYMTSKNSRLGTNIEYDAFLGVLIKKLIKVYGYSPKEAWFAVCDDSKRLGHYYDSNNALKQFEATGRRNFLGFSDLANTGKIIIKKIGDDRITYYTVGGNYNAKGDEYPLADENVIIKTHRDRPYSVGWMVFDV